MAIKIRQKTKHYILATVLIVSLIIALSSIQAKVMAASTGTCYFETNGSVPTYVGPCVDQFPNMKDAKGNTLSPSLCYDVSAGLIATKLSCSDSKFDSGAAQKAACLAHGGTWDDKTNKCSNETIATSNTGKCQTASDNQAAVDNAICSSDCTTANNCSFMNKYIYPLINFLSALIGVAVTISVVIGGIQYASSEGDPQRASAAKNRIRNSLIALVTFIFLYALLNFLVPGGLF